MRVGGSFPGIGPASHYGFSSWWDGLDFQIEWAARLGWRCFQPVLDPNPTPAQLKEMIARLAARDMVIPGVSAHQYNILHPDPEERKNQIRSVIARIELAAEIGGKGVATIAGTLNPAGSHLYYPGNKGEDAWRDFVAGVREICEACRGTGVKFLFEPYTQTLLDSPKSLKRAFDEVDRPGLVGLNFDLVNLVTVERYYDISGLIDETVDLVGPYIESLHVKDVVYRTDLALRLDEVVPGEGVVDFAHWFRHVDALGRDIPAYIEHLRTVDQMMAAWPVIRDAARAVGSA